MKDRSAEYEANDGWSSSLFAKGAAALIRRLKESGVKVSVGRTVIHIGENMKAYVHYNGRTKEYATITDRNGVELQTFHHTEFEDLSNFILKELETK